MQKSLALLSAILFSALVFGQKIGDQTRINFEIGNLMINTVEGSFTGISGDVNFDPAKVDKASFDVRIPIKSIKTGNSTRDKDLHGEKYFHADKYPNARFTSTSVSREGESIVVKGDLTIKGTTRKVSIPFAVSTLTNGYLLSGNLTLDRYDFGVGSSGSFTMGREVELSIQLYLVD